MITSSEPQAECIRLWLTTVCNCKGTIRYLLDAGMNGRFLERRHTRLIAVTNPVTGYRNVTLRRDNQ